MFFKWYIKCMLLLFSLAGISQNNEVLNTGSPGSKRVYTTQKVKGEPPVIDGELNDNAWSQIEWEGEFIQREPNESEQPAYQTKFKVLYDDKNIYFAVLSLDAEPEKIVKRLSRRDGYDGDWIEVSIDSYHDLRTAFTFSLSAAGVKGERLISNDSHYGDKSWNPIWYAKAKINERGWIAEFKIPLSQLRFANTTNQVWGLQVMRRLFRYEERSVWQPIALQENGWVSRFGELEGLTNLIPQKQIELQPFLLTSLDTYEKEANNPFRDGADYHFNAGLDGKIGLTNDLTLDFTINPDFGQVEADPSNIVLDGFQFFFDERRPFFIENKNIFDYKISASKQGYTYDSDQLFYSRRIGRNPQSHPNLENTEVADVPNNTAILGAAKFSGKTENGWSIGLLETVTASEKAKIVDAQGSKREEEVEPATNYFISRLQKDFNQGNTYFGSIFTATNRNLSEDLNLLHKSAYSGGLDFKHHWADRSWYIGGDIVFSHVNGSKEAITATQKSNEHNFDRIDAPYLRVDYNATSLTGTGSNIQLGRIGKGVIFESGFTWRSPQLELNDLGFQRLADDKLQYSWLAYRVTKPFSIFRNIQFNYNHWLSWDFGGNIKKTDWNLNTDFTLKNNWQGGVQFNYKPVIYSISALRGGPRLRFNRETSQWIWFYSDFRKKLRFNGYLQYDKAKDKVKEYAGGEIAMAYQPTNTLKASVSFGYYKTNNHLQYVDNIPIDSDVRYINALIEQNTIDLSFRLNYTINPNLTIQYWGQPFVSRGRYSQFKYITNSIADSFEDRFDRYTPQQLFYSNEDDVYEVDENQDGISDYSFGNPNFSFVQFRSNMVLRWEYIPGSELFVVWSQGATAHGNPFDSLGQNLETEILDRQLDNTLLIKLTYRFSL